MARPRINYRETKPVYQARTAQAIVKPGTKPGTKPVAPTTNPTARPQLPAYQDWVKTDLAFTNKALQYSNCLYVPLILTTPQTSNQGLGAGFNRYFNPDRIDGKRITGIEVVNKAGWIEQNFYEGAPLSVLVSCTVNLLNPSKVVQVKNMPLVELLTNDFDGGNVDARGKRRVFDFIIDLKSSYVNYNDVNAGKLPTNLFIPFIFYFD